MIKLNIQLFGGGTGDAATEFDTTDTNPNNDMVDVTIGGNTYSMPKKAFDNVGDISKNSYQDRAYMAAIYGAYHIATGKDPAQVAREAGYTKTNTDEAYKYIVDTVLRGWVESQGDSLNIPPNWDYENILELQDPKHSYQENMHSYLASGAVKVNGQGYNDWKKGQEQFQEGYVDGLGMPVGVNSRGSYVYKDPETNEYVFSKGGTPITNFGNITDLDGNSIDLNPETNELINTETGTPVVPKTVTPTQAKPLDTAYNQYYNDLFSQQEGTLGKQILSNNINLYEQEAQNARVLANTSMQAQAMTQAQGVKQVTDSIRAERMAQLRAGMSESQLADRELQMLMGSVNQFGAQAQMANQEATAANLAATTAREQAFNDYIAQTTALGQNAAANYASQAGDLVAQAQAYQQRAAAEGRVISITDALNFVSGNTNNPTS